MNDDIVTRLRALNTAERPVPDAYYVSPNEAADEIERLRAENDQWKDVCYSLARYHIEDSDKTVFEIIEDEKRWISQQAQWSETGDIQ